jgi:hypothetical protein
LKVHIENKERRTELAEIIPAIMHGTFPYSSSAHTPRRHAKTAFAKWLSTPGANINGEGGPAPMLSLEDELMLAKLRELSRPVQQAAQDSYARTAEITGEMQEIEDNQYELPLILTPSGKTVNRQI